MSRITSSLAPTLDSLASGIHNIELFRDSADRVAGQVLSICADRLEERDRARSVSYVEDQGFVDKKKTRDKDDDEIDEKKGGNVILDKEDLAPVLGALSKIEKK